MKQWCKGTGLCGQAGRSTSTPKGVEHGHFDVHKGRAGDQKISAGID